MKQNNDLTPTDLELKLSKGPFFSCVVTLDDGSTKQRELKIRPDQVRYLFDLNETRTELLKPFSNKN